MIAALAAALLSVFGHLHPLQAEYYAEVIAEEAWHAGIDPVTLAARGWAESGYRPLTLHAGTYGMLQTRKRMVTLRAQVAEGARALRYWQEWEGRCKQEPAHQYFRHYTWGYRLPSWVKQETQWKMHRVEDLLQKRMEKHAKAQGPGAP